MNPVNADERSRPKTRNQWDKLSESSTDGDEMGSQGKNAGGDRVEEGSKRRRRSVDSSDRNKEMEMMRDFEFVEDFVIGDREKEEKEKEKEKEEEREKEKEKEKEVEEKDKSELLAMVRMMDLEFVEDLVKGERERRERETQKEKEEEKEKGKEEENEKKKEKEKEKQKEKDEEKEKGKEEEKEKEEEEEKEKQKEKDKEEEKDKGKCLALVDVGSASRNNDTKCVALVDSDDSSDDVVFVGETNPIYKLKANNRVNVISVDDDKRGDKQLVLVGASIPSPEGFWLKTGSEVGSVDGRSPQLIAYDSSTSKRRRVDSSFSLSHYYSSDSEDFESSSSSSSDDDDSEDGDFSVNVPSSVFKRADEKGKDAEDGAERRKGIVSRLRSSSNSKPLDNDEREKQNYSELRLGENSVGEDSEQKPKTIAKKRRQGARSLNVKDILLNTVLEKESTLNERLSRPEENAPPLPLKFRFPDEDETPPVKEDWEVEIDNLFADLEMGILQPEAGSSAQTMEKDNGKADDAKGCCHPGGHLFILDEQIGVQCKYCLVVFMEMKHVYPDFAMKSSQRQDKRFLGELEHRDGDDDADFELGDVPANNFAQDVSGETVWDLVPAHIKERMYQHQIDGFEFMWRNIAGGLDIEDLKMLPSNKGKGCIISHAPGTGKTGLSVVFLQSFMKLFPMCRPVVIAPRSMLLTWENEFVKWDVDIPFHNLNNPKLSGKENDVQGSNWKIFKRKSKGRELNRILKLYSWANGSGILGITYRLFEKLAGESTEDEKVRRILLKYPGILVLDEGHTPRNDESLMWRALSKVETPLRIILSGTPFQNNFQELYNTLCLVSPDFSVSTTSRTRNFMQKGKAAKNKWTSITSSIINEENGTRIEELKQMISPFVHVHKGHILLEKLPGLREALVHLRLTDLQQKLLELVSKKNFIEQDNLMTLISVHPSLAPDYIRGEKDLELDPSAGVKTCFVFELVRLCSAHGERVIVFSRLIEPLSLIKQQLLHHLKWSENEEILYMDGKVDAKYRQDRISAFNNPASVAKVLLASTASCCEGINLIGASRIVLLDVVWNPSITRQAISRAYRLGQTKVVYVYNLISSTFEARKYECQARKDRMSELVFSDREESHCRIENLSATDVILEAMAESERLRGMFELIVHQPRAQHID